MVQYHTLKSKNFLVISLPVPVLLSSSYCIDQVTSILELLS